MHTWEIYQYFEPLGWTVIHSLWQGMIIGVLVLFLSKLAPQNSNYRYKISAGGMFLLFFTSLCTFLYLSMETPVFQSGSPVMNSSHSFSGLESMSQITLTDTLFNKIYFVSIIYILGLIFFVSRFIVGLYQSIMLQYSTKSPISDFWINELNRLKKPFGLTKKIALFESYKVVSPLVVGYFKPMILFPIGLINKLDPKEVEAILVHELSHIKRNDYLWNLIISVIHVLFHYHPIAWWMMYNIKTERELCCDENAINQLNNSPIMYAKTLLRLQQYSLQSNRMEMAFAIKDHSFASRMLRILNQPKKTTIMEKLSTSLVLLLAIAGISMALVNKESHLPIQNIQSELTSNLLDTVPKVKKTETIIETINGETKEITIEDGKVTELKINGKQVPEADLENHPETLRLKEELERDKNAQEIHKERIIRKRHMKDHDVDEIERDRNTDDIHRERIIRRPRGFDHISEYIIDADTIIIKRGDGQDDAIIIDGLGSSMKIEIDGEDIIINGDHLERGDEEIIIGEDRLFGPEGFRFHIDDIHGRLGPINEKLKDHFKDFDWNGEFDDEQLKSLKEKFQDFDFNFDFSPNLKFFDSLGVFDFNFDIKSFDDFPGQHNSDRLHRGSKKSIKQMLETELIRDGLIEGRDNYSFHMDQNRLKVNNKRMSKEFYDKYRFLYQKWTDKPFSNEIEFLERTKEKL